MDDFRVMRRLDGLGTAKGYTSQRRVQRIYISRPANTSAHLQVQRLAQPSPQLDDGASSRAPPLHRHNKLLLDPSLTCAHRTSFRRGSGPTTGHFIAVPLIYGTWCLAARPDGEPDVEARVLDERRFRRGATVGCCFRGGQGAAGEMYEPTCSPRPGLRARDGRTREDSEERRLEKWWWSPANRSDSGKCVSSTSELVDGTGDNGDAIESRKGYLGLDGSSKTHRAEKTHRGRRDGERSLFATSAGSEWLEPQVAGSARFSFDDHSHNQVSNAVNITPFEAELGMGTAPCSSLRTI
ncbi:hypothetical protein FB451DRAFT_1175664 [Mycena latifolia]|nr:hypothetical protein FB451DRAFT_1175664 [Mycena latifolia]